MSTPDQLEGDVSRAFERACQERDWEVAEYLLQALEAIAKRDGDEPRVDAALNVLVQEWTKRQH